MKPEIVSGARRAALHALLAVASLAAPASLRLRIPGALWRIGAYDVSTATAPLEGARRKVSSACIRRFPRRRCDAERALKKVRREVRAWRGLGESIAAYRGRSRAGATKSMWWTATRCRSSSCAAKDCCNSGSPYHADLIPAAVPVHREWAWPGSAYSSRLTNAAGEERGATRFLR